MTNFAARRAIAGGRNARVFSQGALTNFKSLYHKRGWHRFGAGLFYRKIDERDKTLSANIQANGFASRY
jgi:hypothetical protein